MSGMAIFVVGLVVSTLCLFGLFFTITEIGRLNSGESARARTPRR